MTRPPCWRGQQVDGPLEEPRVGADLSQHPQARDAAVGVDPQPDVGPRAVVGHLEGVLGVPAQPAAWHRRRPRGALELRPGDG